MCVWVGGKRDKGYECVWEGGETSVIECFVYERDRHSSFNTSQEFLRSICQGTSLRLALVTDKKFIDM